MSTTTATFGRHETFPLRYAWLTKGLEALRQQPDIFAQPEQAMVALGVGRNMVSAIHYWLQVVGVAELTPTAGRITPLGEALLGPNGDPYLEDEASLWIIHWLIASNAQQATGFFWFFNQFALPRFREDELRVSLSEFVTQHLQLKRAQSTLKSDCSTLLRMYTPASGRNEDHLDSPLAHLSLIESDVNRYYHSPRRVRPFLPALALHFALIHCFNADPQPSALPIRTLLYADYGGAAPGAVFRLNEEGLMQALTQVLHDYPGCYELRDTAGVHQLYRVRDLGEPLQCLYRRNH